MSKNTSKPQVRVAKSKQGESSQSEFLEYATELVDALANVMDRHALTEIVVENGEYKVSLRHAPEVPYPQPVVVPSAPPVVSAVSAEPAPEKAAGHYVESPFVGTFYRRPNPNADEYVGIGSKVNEGQVLCIVEAMKLMNEIEADVSGTVAEILVEDGSPVEFGQRLFRIEQ